MARLIGDTTGRQTLAKQVWLGQEEEPPQAGVFGVGAASTTTAGQKKITGAADFIPTRWAASIPPEWSQGTAPLPEPDPEPEPETQVFASETQWEGEQKSEKPEEDLVGGWNVLDWEKAYRYLPTTIFDQTWARITALRDLGLTDNEITQIRDAMSALNFAYGDYQEAHGDAATQRALDDVSATLSGLLTSLETKYKPPETPEPPEPEPETEPPPEPEPEPELPDVLDLGFLARSGLGGTLFNPRFLESGGSIWTEISDWYSSQDRFSAEAAKIVAEGLMRQISDAWKAGDNERLAVLAGRLKEISPTAGAALEAKLAGPGEGFSDLFTFNGRQYAANPSTGEIVAWDVMRGAWTKKYESGGNPVMDYYINNIYAGDVQQGTVEKLHGYIEGVGPPNEAGIYEFTYDTQPTIAGGGTVYSAGSGRQFPASKYSYDPGTKQMTFVGGITDAAIIRLQQAGWTHTRGGPIREWKWTPPAQPYTPSGPVVEGPGYNEKGTTDVRITGNAGA